MEPQIVNRDDLLDDPRFWCLLYEPWVNPCVGDPFTDGEDYYFSVREESVGDLFHQMEGMSVGEDHFPAVSVLVDLPGGWRAGVDLMLCPQDFEFDYVVVPPHSEKHKIIGVHGGNHWLPALRWEEVLALAGAIRPANAMSNARGVLLFYPACLPGEDRREEVADVLRRSWRDFGFPVWHLEEWIQRTCQCEANIRWKQDPNHGWLCESESSLRNSKWIGRHHRWTPGMLEAVAKLFSVLGQ